MDQVRRTRREDMKTIIGVAGLPLESINGIHIDEETALRPIIQARKEEAMRIGIITVGADPLQEDHIEVNLVARLVIIIAKDQMKEPHATRDERREVNLRQ
ncbi:uncharacterized protein VTP21DRAFT_7938 [Calcarisporiella thermophila]|uniref:uncharacterized protein n=1 Tax=Calcarisporiella thermophila TaxID=911321 RepID=UPI003742F5CA